MTLIGQTTFAKTYHADDYNLYILNCTVYGICNTVQPVFSTERG